MADFEKQINELLLTYRERQITQDNSNKQSSFNIVTHDIPLLILKRLNEYVGDIEIKILYGDKNIIAHRLIPYNKETDSLADKQNIDWQVLQ